MSEASALARSAARQARRAIEDVAAARDDGRVSITDITGTATAVATPQPPRLRDGASGALARAMARQSGLTIAELPGATSTRAAPLAAITPLRTAAVRATSPIKDRAPDEATFDERQGFPPSRRLALSSMRRVIADRLSTSKREAPHYYMSVDCQADALLAMRRDLNATLPEGERLSVNDLILAMTAHCLAHHRALNAAWAGDALVEFEHVNLAVAVAVDGGLVTPVLRHADALSLGAIHAGMQALMDAARRRALPREAFQGGTFTVSNLGMYPISQFAAIVNPPQAAILAVAAAQRRVVALDDTRSAVRQVMSLTLSVDHRVADGVAGAEFLAELRALIEEPRRALL